MEKVLLKVALILFYQSMTLALFILLKLLYTKRNMSSNKKEKSLVQTWRNSGIDEGDTILIHSSIKRTMQDITNKGIPFNADDLLQSFIEAVNKWNFSFSTFNFNFKEDKFFDINKQFSYGIAD